MYIYANMRLIVFILICAGLLASFTALGAGSLEGGYYAITKPQNQQPGRDHFITEDTLGVGVCISEECRFYPLDILLWHEVVNDTLNNKAISVTYSPATGTIATYTRTSDRQPAVLTSTRVIKKGSLLLAGGDNAASTSFWSQLSSKFIEGDSKYSDLQPIPFERRTWKDWYFDHPQSTILSRNTGEIRPYGVNPYQEYEQNDRLPLNTQNFGILHPKTIILGISSEKSHRAYKLSAIPIGVTYDTFAGKKIEITRNARDKITIQEKSSKKEIYPIWAYWFAWKNTHPQTTLFTSK